MALFLSLTITGHGVAADSWKTGDPAQGAAKVYTFHYVPADTDRTLNDFLRFVQVTSQGIEGLRAQYLVADIYLQHGDYKRASLVLQRLAAVALDDQFFNISVLQKLADCYMHQGLFKQAADAYETVSKSNFKAVIPESILGMAVAALAQGEKEQAYLHFQELIAFYPAYKTHQALMLPLGLIQWENGKFQDALDYFLQDDKNPASLYFAALCQRSLKKTVDAMGTFKRVSRDFPQTSWADRARFELGETFYRQKDYPLAAQTFEQVRKEQKEDLWQVLALYRLACSDMQVKQYKPAEEKLWPLFRKNQKHPLYPRITYLLTEDLAQQKKLDKVVALLRREIKGKSKTPDNMYRLIWSLTAVGKYPEAIKLSNDFLNTGWDPELTPKTLLIQGYAYDRMGRVPESVASYQLVVDRFPETFYAARALQLMAMTYYRAKQYAPVATQVNYQWNTLSADVRKKNPETLFWIAEAHLQLKNGKQARAFYQKFLDMAPPDHGLASQALLGQAVSYALDKDFDTAVLTLQRTFQSAQEKNDKGLMAAATLQTGNVFFNAKNYEGAASSYRQFQQIDTQHPQMALALYQEGLALHRSEYYSDAIATWQKLVKAYPDDDKAPEALFRGAKTRFDMGQYADAVKDYEQLLKSYPKTDYAKEARLQIGQCHYNAGNYAKAITAYSDFLNRYPNDELAPQVLQLLQTCYYQAKKTPEEIEKLTKDQAKSPVLADIYWEEGAKLYNEKNYDKARAYFQKILLEFPSSSIAPQASFYRAESFYLQEKYVEAIFAYENFLQYYPQDEQRGPAMFHLAVSLFNNKDYGEAAKAFRDFAGQFPDDPMAKNATLNAALCYAKALDIDQAIPAYQNYLDLYPDAEDAGATYLQMGQLLEKFGQDRQAAEAYKKVPQNLGEYPEALFNAGRVYRKLNDEENERQAYEPLLGYPAKDDPYRIAGLLQLAEIYLAKNEQSRALAVYEDVAANAADDASKAAAQERLGVLQGGK